MLTKTDYYDCNLQTDWNLVISLKHCSHDWESNKTLSTWSEVHGNMRSPLWPFTRPGCRRAIYYYYGLYACVHRGPSSRPNLRIRTIAETNMGLWTCGRPCQLCQTPGRQHVEMNILGKIAVFTKEGCFLV